MNKKKWVLRYVWKPGTIRQSKPGSRLLKKKGLRRSRLRSNKLDNAVIVKETNKPAFPGCLLKARYSAPIP